MALNSLLDKEFTIPEDAPLHEKGFSVAHLRHISGGKARKCREALEDYNQERLGIKDFRDLADMGKIQRSINAQLKAEGLTEEAARKKKEEQEAKLTDEELIIAHFGLDGILKLGFRGLDGKEVEDEMFDLLEPADEEYLAAEIIRRSRGLIRLAKKG